ncbi:unnamed protein product (macronuclear) [Paramecium tetraurelia]|uniref:MORN repeat protein n=1 Tax=Paramecium tetraurelia TaxID=5888 RepID=A0E4M8_PARTE|nr:uncharacterized protein GSPATT00023420001 [Paramecium tetraurelia]CAK90245.1 unnamed protein product [Paramecium tetraurelia]|eukprot:XP_001457642.1 hypothetical protein (macronuclear) [Paramecium tetraurelia strain d4-2]
MGQVLASDYVELYAIQENPNNQSKHSVHDKSKIDHSQVSHVAPPIQPKPKPNQTKSANIDQIKGLRIYLSQEITNEFPDLDPVSYQRHEIADGEYYGRFQNSNREGDGVLALKKKPIQKGQNDQDQLYKFFGTYRNGQAAGNGYAFFHYDYSLWGEVQKNEFKGKAILKTKDNQTYQGIWDERKLKYGIIQTQLYKYVGQFKDGLREGLGECHYSDGTIIKGNWKQDNLDQLCHIQFPDNTFFSGHFFEGMKHGFGLLQQQNQTYFGEFDCNVKHGFGLLIQPEDIQMNQSQHKQKHTEALYFQGVQKGIYCVYTEKENKQWFQIKDNNEIEKLEHVTEKRGLAELLSPIPEHNQPPVKSLEAQKADLEKAIKEMMGKVNEIQNNSNQFMSLEKQMDSQTIKLGQLATYQDWIDQNKQ